MYILKYLRKKLFVKIVKKVLLHLGDAPNSSKNILDIGCGSGDFFNQNLDLSIYGIDNDYKSIKNNANQKVVFGNAIKLPFLDNSFDGVIAMLFFHSVALIDQKRALAEIKRVLKSNGKLIILDFCLPRSMLGKIVGQLLSIEERFCCQKHYQNYIGFMTRGGLEGFLHLGGLEYEVIDRYRFGNLVLMVVILNS